MNNELILRYLYFLTHMYSGKEEWEIYYQAWTAFGNNLGSEDYEVLIDKIIEFKALYGNKL